MPLLTGFSPDELPEALRGGIAAIGNFDGVHSGHAQLLGQAVASARQQGIPAVALTFDPHPRTFFGRGEPVMRITPPAARARLLEALGLDALVIARFDAEFAALSPEAFIETVLLQRLAISGVVVGFNFRFGHKRAGDAELLRQRGETDGFAVTVVEPVNAGDEVVASSSVRSALAEGDVKNASVLLGYRWFVVEKVIEGEKRGRDLGFPTANMELWPDCGLRHGIYAVTARLPDGRIIPGVASYGRRPTFDNGAPLLETFLFDFDESLYGQELAISFVDWIRGEAKFQSVNELVDAMNGDAARARSLIAAAPALTQRDRQLGLTA